VSPLTPEEEKERAEFKALMAGLPAYSVARCLNSLQHGVDYRGCSKTDLAETWATRHRTDALFRNLRHFTIQTLTVAVIAEQERRAYGAKLRAEHAAKWARKWRDV